MMPLSIDDKKKIDLLVIAPLLHDVRTHIGPEENDPSGVKKAAMISNVLRIAIAYWIDGIERLDTHENIVDFVNGQARLGRVTNSEDTINFLEFYTNLDEKIQSKFPLATNAEVQTYIRIALFKAIDPLANFMRLQKQFSAIISDENRQVASKSKIESLPVDVLKLVFDYLGLVDCIACYATSQKFHLTILDTLNRKAREVFYILGNRFTHSEMLTGSLYGTKYRRRIPDDELIRAFDYPNPVEGYESKQESSDEKDNQEVTDKVYLFDNFYTIVEYLNYLSQLELDLSGIDSPYPLTGYVILAVLHKYNGVDQMNWKNKEIQVHSGIRSSEYNPNSRSLDMQFAKVNKNDLLPIKGIAAIERSFGLFKICGVLDRTKPKAVLENTTENKNRTCTIL